MKCPYSDRFMPRCQIVTHPDKQDVEYCRVCGEWRRVSQVGDELPNLFLIAIAIAIIMMILTSLLNESEQRTRRERTLNFLQIEAETEPGSVRTRGIVGGVAEKQGSGNRG